MKPLVCNFILKDLYILDFYCLGTYFGNYVIADQKNCIAVSFFRLCNQPCTIWIYLHEMFNNHLLSCETQKRASLSFCTLMASVSIRGLNCCRAGLSRIVSRVLLSINLCCTSSWCKESNLWWEASTGFFESVLPKPNSSNRCKAVLYASMWRCSSVFRAAWRFVRPVTSGVSPWHPKPVVKSVLSHKEIRKLSLQRYITEQVTGRCQWHMV